MPALQLVWAPLTMVPLGEHRIQVAELHLRMEETP